MICLFFSYIPIKSAMLNQDIWSPLLHLLLRTFVQQYNWPSDLNFWNKRLRVPLLDPNWCQMIWEFLPCFPLWSTEQTAASKSISAIPNAHRKYNPCWKELQPFSNNLLWWPDTQNSLTDDCPTPLPWLATSYVAVPFLLCTVETQTHRRVPTVMKVNELSKHGNLPEHCGPWRIFSYFPCLSVKKALTFQS